MTSHVTQMLVVLAGVIHLAAPNSANAQEKGSLDSARAKSLASRLGDIDDAKRAAAAKELRNLGPDAIFPVLQAVAKLKSADTKLIARTAACRSLAFDEPTTIDRLTTCDPRLKIKPELLRVLAEGLGSTDTGRQRLSGETLSLLCFSAGGSPLPEIRSACASAPTERLDAVINGAVTLHAGAIASAIELCARPSDKVEVVPIHLYQEQLRPIGEYGPAARKTIERFRGEADRQYKRWEEGKSTISITATDEQWQAYVGMGSAYYTQRIVFNELVKLLQDAK